MTGTIVEQMVFWTGATIVVSFSAIAAVIVLGALIWVLASFAFAIRAATLYEPEMYRHFDNWFFKSLERIRFSLIHTFKHLPDTIETREGRVVFAKVWLDGKEIDEEFDG